MADNIHINLPDGSSKEVPKGTTALDVAKSISPRLADAALVAKTNGDLIDLTRPLEKDTTLRILTEKDPESLQVFRHSSAHLLAAAVLELFPETKLGHGPATEDRILLRLLPSDRLHARRSREDRKEDARTGAAEHPLRARISPPPGRPGEVQGRRGFHEVPFHRAVHPAR
jgi:threonyl-tRNA synthetase